MTIDITIEEFEMINALKFGDNLMVGGQPSVNDFKKMQSMGISQVINLRPVSEKIDFDQVALLSELGMEYTLIPLTDISTFTLSSAQKLKEILTLQQPTLIHCASGNRVGALIALSAFWCDELPAEEAYQKGIQGGLTKLAPQVKTLLGLE